VSGEKVTERQHNRNHLVRMRLASSALVAVVLSSTLFLVLPATASGLKIAGTSCKRLGLKSTSQNKNYQCVKKGKKLVWSLRTPVIRTKPTASVTPTPKPTLSPSPSPSPEAAPYALPDPNTLSIPEAASKYMAENTILMGGSLACSGSLIRNDLGESIGIVTAQHCNLTDYQNKRHLGSDGKYYVIAENHVTANTGDVQDKLTSVGVVDKFYLPDASNTTLDLALGAFGGHNIQEVRTAYNKNRLTSAEINALKPGDTIYLSGWPIDQFNNPGMLERQSFELKVLGVEDRFTNGYIGDVSLVWAAVLQSKKGAVCSYGNSGGEGFIIINGEPRSVGVLREFIDFTGNIYAQPTTKVDPKGFEQKFNVTGLSKYSAICNFAYETPAPENGGVEVNVVTSTDQIPGYKP
jgi:hypothetical protein